MTPVRAEVQPPELARLVDLAERPREHDWSLRAALTRYAQPQPQRASDVIELVRRMEFAMRPHAALLQRDGPALWAGVTAGGDTADDDGDRALVIGLLRAMATLDELGDALAAWAHDPATGRPDALVDAVTADVTQRLEQLGVPREERPPRPTGRSGRGV